MYQISSLKYPLPSILLKKCAATSIITFNATPTTTTPTKITSPPAALTTKTTRQPQIQTKTIAKENTLCKNSRRCIFGCEDNSAVLCRFPVHDRRRCEIWLKFFKVDEDFIRTHGLSNLRVCLRHLQVEMAKTRIKTTPTRLQKDALAAADIKKRLRQANSTQETKGPAILNVTSSVLVAPPKRTSSMSSTSSVVSFANGDSMSVNTNSNDQQVTSESNTALSSYSPNSPHNNSINTTGAIGLVASAPTTTTTPALTTKTINCQQLNNRKQYLGNNFMLRNRKVFMITEHCEDQQRHDLVDASTDIGKNGKISSCSGQKRKMYLIMEETPTQQQQQQEEEEQLPNNDSASAKFIKNEFGGNTTKKKLTLFADRCDAHLTQKFEQILPEIIHRINSTVRDRATTTTTTTIQTTPVAIVTAEPIKRTIITPKTTTPIAPNKRVTENDHDDDEDAVYLTQVKHEKSLSIAANGGVDGGINGVIVGSDSPSDAAPDEAVSRHVPITLPPKKNRMKIINTAAASGQCLSAATPVIVSTAQALSSSRYNSWSGNGSPASLQHHQTQSTPPHQKNINLSTDFLFLMKMLPKLEAIPEPHKNHVKNCIEKIVTQNAALFQEQ